MEKKLFQTATSSCNQHMFWNPEKPASHQLLKHLAMQNGKMLYSPYNTVMSFAVLIEILESCLIKENVLLI